MSDTFTPNIEYNSYFKNKLFHVCFSKLFRKGITLNDDFTNKMNNCVGKLSESYKYLLEDYNSRMAEQENLKMDFGEEEEDEDDEDEDDE